MVAVLRCPEGSRLTGGLAAALYGMEGFSLTSTTPQILIPPGKTVTNVAFLTTTNLLPGKFEATLPGIPAVTPARALIESDATPVQLRTAFDSARWTGLVTVQRLRDCL